MKIKVNGESTDVQGKTIIDVLTESNVANPDMVSVQLNGEFVRKENYASLEVKENDEIDFLYFMGGGQR